MPTALPAWWTLERARPGAAGSRTAGSVQAGRFEALGFEVIEHVLDEGECRVIASSLASSGLVRAGARGLLAQPWCRELARRVARHFGIARRLPPDAVAAQATLFTKSADQNWLVAFHQDLGIPVYERLEPPGSRGWSEQGGIVFVQPAVSVLEQLVVVRLHLDDCGADNGALRIIPGSHRFGRLTAATKEKLRAANAEAVCAVGRGGVLLMRPLLLHASSKSSSERPRRVLHFLFGPPRLSDGLEWQKGAVTL